MSDTYIKIEEKRFEDWVIGSSVSVSTRLFHKIIRLSRQKNTSSIAGLEGRAQVVYAQLEDLGPVIIKHYMRGGIIQYFLENNHFKNGFSRARVEYEILEYAYENGIQVPEPVFYLEKERRFYSCWLATQEIPNRGTIATVSLKHPEHIHRLMDQVSIQINKMITKGIYHVDLHPGNILVSRDNKIFVVDFDKARKTKMSADSLEKRYVKRWNRAIRKHKLPDRLLTSSFLSRCSQFLNE